jgi:hypothetical protein
MSTPAYIANTRQLLHSLEELRNSLSSRLEQLSLAIDRLRGEATEVERAVSTGSMLTGFERRSHSQFEPLPRVSLPRSQNPIISRGGVPPLRLEDDGPLVRAIDRSGRTASRRGPSPPPAPRGRPRLGLAPTNLAAVAAQPKPAVVRSRSVSLSSNDSSSSSSDEEDLPGTVGEGEFPTAPAGAAALAATVSASVSAAASSTVSDAASASAPSDELSTTDEVFPLTVPIDIDSIIRRALSNDPEDAALTFTGMRVEDRLRSSSQPVRPSMSSPRSREDLDREIHQIRRRIETARQELQRRLERGSRAADDIMSRNNALHAHTRQLWMLVARRTRLYGGSPLAFVGSVLDSPPSPIEPLPVASALRAGSNLASSRRWPANFDDASPSASPGTSPTAPTDVPATATIESTATPSFELANPRERDRRRNNGLGLGLGLNLPRNRDLTDNLFRERDTSPRTADSRLSEDDETPTYRYTPLPRSRDGNEPQFFDDFQLYLSQDDRTGSGMRGELRTSPRERERERERQREHSLEREQEREGEPARSATRAARATTPDGTDLATEEPATRRVLEGIELMMSAPNITPHMRSRLERLAERERVLLRDLETSLAPSRRSRRSRTRTDPSTFGTRGSLMLENPNSNANSNSNSNSTSAPNRTSRDPLPVVRPRAHRAHARAPPRTLERNPGSARRARLARLGPAPGVPPRLGRRDGRPALVLCR